MEHETAAARRRRKRRESRHRAKYGIRPHRAMTEEEAQEKRDLELRAPGITKEQAEALNRDPKALRDPNDGQCHATTRKGARCKNRTDGRWCTRHRQDH